MKRFVVNVLFGLAMITAIGAVCAMGYLNIWSFRSVLSGATHKGPWVYGPAQAQFTITEYIDLECPYCKQYAPQLKRWVSEQPNVNLRWHHMPLNIHGPVAVQEARLVQCAGKMGGNEAFWKAAELVLANTQSNGEGLQDAGAYKRLPGNEEGKLEDCARTDREVEFDVDTHVRSAEKVGIRATPTLVVTHNPSGERIMVEGAADFDTLRSALDLVAEGAKPTTPSSQAQSQ